MPPAHERVVKIASALQRSDDRDLLLASALQEGYEQAVETFLKTSRLSDSERAMLMGGGCAKAYGWSVAEES
jgi:hypothetical protein